MSMKHGRIRGQQLHLTGEGKESRPAYNAGQLYPVDPVAVERLKAIMAQQVRPVVPKEKGEMPHQDRNVEFKVVDDSALNKLGMASDLILTVETDVPAPQQAATKGKSMYDPVMDVILRSPVNKWLRFQLKGKEQATRACSHFKKKTFRAYLATTGRRIEAHARRSPDQPDTTSWLYARWVKVEANGDGEK